MTLQKIDPGARVGDQVFEILLAGVLSGHFAEGDRLRIRDLAEEIGTSVMPVREAIRRLEEIGLAEAVPYRGAVIKSFTGTELLHLYAVRRILEVDAARLGAERVSDDDVLAMREQLELMEQAVREKRAVDYLDHDENLLALIYGAAGNPVLMETIRSLWNRCRPYKIVGAKQELDTGDPEALSSYQKMLIEACSRRDAEHAERATAESLDAAIERIRGAMDG